MPKITDEQLADTRQEIERARQALEVAAQVLDILAPLSPAQRSRVLRATIILQEPDDKEGP